jgi:hypothetical protein
MSQSDDRVGAEHVIHRDDRVRAEHVIRRVGAEHVIHSDDRVGAEHVIQSDVLVETRAQAKNYDIHC